MAVCVLLPAAVEAVRPLDTEDTGVLEPGSSEVETSLDLARRHAESTFGTHVVVSHGVLPHLEARVETGVAALDRPGHGASAGPADSLIGFKFRLRDDSTRGPGVLLAAAVSLPTGDEDRGLGDGDPAVLALIALSHALGPVTLTANAGYVWSVAGRAGDTVLAALAAEYRLGAGWTLVGELVGTLGVGEQPDRLVSRVGAAWQVNPHIRLDAAAATAIGRGSDDLLVTVGATFRF